MDCVSIGDAASIGLGPGERLEALRPYGAGLPGKTEAGMWGIIKKIKVLNRLEKGRLGRRAPFLRLLLVRSGFSVEETRNVRV